MRSQDSRILNRNERSRRFTANERVERMLVTIRGKMRMHSELGFATDAEQLLWLFFFVRSQKTMCFCFVVVLFPQIFFCSMHVVECRGEQCACLLRTLYVFNAIFVSLDATKTHKRSSNYDDTHKKRIKKED